MLGLYTLRPPAGHPVHAILIASVFPPPLGARVSRVYDLKGSTYHREAPPSASVQMDLNFVKDMRSIGLTAPVRDALLRQLHADVRLLRDEGVMDYSLLVGVADVPPGVELPEQVAQRNAAALTHRLGFLSGAGTHVFQLGIIDVTQKYTLKKQVCVRVLRATCLCMSCCVCHFVVALSVSVSEAVWKRCSFCRGPQLEHHLKSLKLRSITSTAVSSVDSDSYAARFMKFMTDVIVVDSGGEVTQAPEAAGGAGAP